MPTANDLGPDLSMQRCHVCGEDLGLSYWIHDRQYGVHTGCRDWSRVEFIFDRQVRLLRRRRGEPGVGEVLSWLEGARRKRPEDAVAVVREGRKKLRAVGVW